MVRSGSRPRDRPRSTPSWRRDPATAERLKPADRARIARALEVLEATGVR